MTTDLITQIVAVPGGAALIMYLGKRAIETLIEQDRKIRKLELDSLKAEVEDLESRLQHTNIVVQDQLLPKLESMKEAVIRNTAKQEAMQDTIAAHGKQLEVILPAIKAQVEKLSMYWKSTGNK